MEGCGDGREIVEMPVELDEGQARSVVDGGNYRKVVERGFLVQWIAPDCRECDKSGGWCGTNMTTRQFVCFCHDRPHRVSCKPGKMFSVFVICLFRC